MYIRQADVWKSQVAFRSKGHEFIGFRGFRTFVRFVQGFPAYRGSRTMLQPRAYSTGESRLVQVDSTGWFSALVALGWYPKSELRDPAGVWPKSDWAPAAQHHIHKSRLRNGETLRSKKQGTSTKHLGWSLLQLQRTGPCKYWVRLTGFQLIRGLIDMVWSARPE